MVIALKTFEKVNIFLTFCYMFSQTADLNSKLSRDFANCRFRKLQISQITDFANNRFRKVQISFRFVSFRFLNYSKPSLTRFYVLANPDCATLIIYFTAEAGKYSCHSSLFGYKKLYAGYTARNAQVAAGLLQT